MSKLIKDEPHEEKLKYLNELIKVTDEIEAIYDRYNERCRETHEEFFCIMSHFIGPAYRKMCSQIDKVRELL